MSFGYQRHCTLVFEQLGNGIIRIRLILKISDLRIKGDIILIYHPQSLPLSGRSDNKRTSESGMLKEIGLQAADSHEVQITDPCPNK